MSIALLSPPQLEMNCSLRRIRDCFECSQIVFVKWFNLNTGIIRFLHNKSPLDAVGETLVLLEGWLVSQSPEFTFIDIHIELYSLELFNGIKINTNYWITLCCNKNMELFRIIKKSYNCVNTLERVDSNSTELSNWQDLRIRILDEINCF